jgi:hypothetical protein
LIIIDHVDDFKCVLNNMDLVISSIEEWSKNARKIWQELLYELKEKMWILNYWKEYK